MARNKKHLRSDINHGKFDLPRSLSFLEKQNYVAVIDVATDSKRKKWHVELTALSARVLFKGKVQAANAEKTVADAEKKIEDLEVRIKELTQRNDDLEKEAIQLKEDIRQRDWNLKVISENGNIGADTPRERSQLTSLGAAQKHGTDFSKRGYQGGDGGIGKK